MKLKVGTTQEEVEKQKEAQLKHDAAILRKLLDLLEPESENTRNRVVDTAVKFFNIYISRD